MKILKAIKESVKKFTARMGVYEVAAVFAQANLRGYARTLLRKKHL